MLQNKTARSLLAIILMMTVVLAACSNNEDDAQSEPVEDSVVATYDGGQVMSTELTTFKNVSKLLNPEYAQYAEMLDPNYEENLLRQLSGMKVLVSKASAELVEAEKTKSESDFNEMKQQIESNEENKKQWEDQLKNNQVSEADVVEFVTRSNTARAYLEEQYDDAQVEEKYEQLLQENAFTIATVSHILIVVNDPQTQEELRTPEAALEIAEEVKQKLDEGGDFAALAQEYSEDDGSKDNGGMYADVNVNEWDPSFGQAVLDLPLNEVSDPVETSFGYHIIKVDSRSELALEEVRVQVEGELMNEFFSDFLENDLLAINFEMNLPKKETE